MKWDLQHVALIAAPFVAACGTAFVDYMQNSAEPFSKVTLEHAALATVLVFFAVLKASPRQQAAS